MKVVTAAEMRAIEQRAVEQGTALQTLMNAAGRALAATVTRVAGPGRVVILAGPGNNGGDGTVAGSALQQDGRDVALYTFHREDTDPFDGPVIRAEDDHSGERLRALLDGAAAVVDCLLGIGQTRPPHGVLANILEEANRLAPGVKVACDIPTGVNADSGSVAGAAFSADMTVVMGFLKRGNVLYPGATCNGSLELADVGLPATLAQNVPVSMPDDTDVAHLLPRREQDSNKGSFGTVLFAGGSQDFCGAPMLAGLAAYRAGAGLVDIAVPASIQPIVATHALEPVYTRLSEEDGQISPGAVEAIESRLSRTDVVLLGPGMGKSERTLEFTRRFLTTLSASKVRDAVIDADGLNCLAEIERWWQDVPFLVLTPHPGEMSRLTGRPISEVQKDRIATAKEFAQFWGQVVVLKGARTVVAAPNGRISINPTGGPNLATGGTGDVLGGIIAGLLAQGLERFDAAIAGTYVHGRAGDILAERHGNAGTLAGDLLDVIPEATFRILQEGVEQA